MAQRLSPIARNDRGIRLEVKDRLKKKIQIVRENADKEVTQPNAKQQGDNPRSRNKTTGKITSRPQG